MEIFSLGFSTFICCLYCLIGLVSILLFFVWVWMLIDVVQRDDNNFGTNSDSSSKALWILIILLTGGIGALIYFFMIYKKYPR